MSAKNWFEMEDRFKAAVDNSLEDLKRGGDVEKAAVFSNIAIAFALRLIAEAISESHD